MSKLNYYLCPVYFSEIFKYSNEAHVIWWCVSVDFVLSHENGPHINQYTVIVSSLVNVLFTDLLAVVQGAGAGGGLFASTDAVMLRHHEPAGDRLPAAAALRRLAPGHHVLDARSVRPAAAQTSAAGHAAKPPNRSKQHCAGLAASDVQLDSRGVEVRLLPGERGGGDQRAV